MPRLKFVATEIKKGTGAGSGGFQTLTPAATAMYLESNSTSIRVDGTTTLIIDNITGDQYKSAKTYTSVITALDTASASPSNQVDLT